MIRHAIRRRVAGHGSTRAVGSPTQCFTSSGRVRSGACYQATSRRGRRSGGSSPAGAIPASGLWSWSVCCAGAATRPGGIRNRPWLYSTPSRCCPAASAPAKVSEQTAENVSVAGNGTCSPTSTACRSRSASPAPSLTIRVVGWTLLQTAKPQLTQLSKVFADAAYVSLVGRAGEELGVEIDIRRRPEGTHWFVPLQPLWRVERTFAWLGRNRRRRHDFEGTVSSSQTFVHTAAVAFMLLAEPGQISRLRR